MVLIRKESVRIYYSCMYLDILGTVFNIPDQGSNLNINILPAKFPPLKKKFLPALFPLSKFFPLATLITLLKNLISPSPIPPSPEIIWPIPHSHHPPHPLTQKSKFTSPSYIFHFPIHIPLLNFFCSSPFF